VPCPYLPLWNCAGK
nr:Chain B, GXpep-3 [Escherichia phage T7]